MLQFKSLRHIVEMNRSFFYQLDSIALDVEKFYVILKTESFSPDIFPYRDESEFCAINLTSLWYFDRNSLTDLDNRDILPCNETRNLRARWNRRRSARTLKAHNDAVAAATRPTCWSIQVENAQQVVTIERQVARPAGLRWLAAGLWTKFVGLWIRVRGRFSESKGACSLRKFPTARRRIETDRKRKRLRDRGDSPMELCDGDSARQLVNRIDRVRPIC